MTTKQITANLRAAIKAAGVKARVRFITVCREHEIQVYTPKHDIDFSADEQRTIKNIAIAAGLTFVCGIEINVEQMTNPSIFYFHP